MITVPRSGFSNQKLQAAFIATIAEGLHASLASDGDKWALRYRVMGSPFAGPFSFDHHPWTRDMHKSKAAKNVGKKAAQMGYSETMLNVTFHALDQMHQDVLYVLPNTKPDATDFSAARFDTALEASKYIARMFSNVKNVGHKRAGMNNLYIRGSRSRSAMKSIPAGVVILDEFEEFAEGVLPLVTERMSGQLLTMLWLISTPMVPNAGIDKEYNLSDQRHFMFKCPRCSRSTELIFPDCLVVTAESITDPKIKGSHLICKECKGMLEHKEKVEFLRDGWWEPMNSDSEIAGFYINQLYSMAKAGQPVELAMAYLKSLIDAADEQEFWNSKMGMAHIVANAAVTDEHINGALRDYVMGDPRYVNQDYITTMGIDVGGDCHYEIVQYMINKAVPSTDINFMAKARVLKVGKIKEFEDAIPLIIHYKPAKIVIDDMPDTRAALKFARQFPQGLVSLCHYGQNANAREILDYGERITVNRTVWLDQSLGRFINGSIYIPKDIPQEYKNHVKALVRVYAKDAKGETQSFYKAAGRDHFGHARNYAEIALPLAFKRGTAIINMTEKVV